MMWSALLMTGVVAVMPLNLVLASSCNLVEINAGLCSITPSTTDSAVVLDGSVSGSEPSGGGWSEGWSEADSGPERCDRLFAYLDCFVPPGGPLGDGAPVVTIADVASFVPTLEWPTSEPSGWGIAGLPVNLVGPAGSSVVGATLLGAPAEVRFTPVRWVWDLGDGTVREAPVPGRSWGELGVGEFSATDTSHVYAARGTYRVGLTVVLAAEYRVGGGAWLPVPGTVAAAAPGFDLVIAAASTVLVDRDCRTGAPGPGC